MMKKGKSLVTCLVVGVLLTIGIVYPIAAQGPHRAGLVVQFGDGTVQTECVTFTEDEITGTQLLENANFEIVTDTSESGTTICKIGDDGCPSDDCFCGCAPPDYDPCMYWTYWIGQPDGSWVASDTGVDGRTVTDGAVDGYHWTGDSSAPPDTTFDSICPTQSIPAMSPWGVTAAMVLLAGAIAWRKQRG